MTAPAIIITRLPDWPERLAAYLQASAGQRFAWGSHDCVRFAAGAVLAVTGRDLLPAQWHDRRSAARLLRTLGGLPAAVGAVLPALAGPQLAQRGDVLLVAAPVAGGRAQRRWLAVADGARWWAPGPGGLACGPAHGGAARPVHAWGVGHA